MERKKIKWLDKPASPELLEIIGIIVIIMFIFILIGDLSNFHISFKNIDNSWNMETLSRQFCEEHQIILNLSDTASDFNSYSSKSFYISGMNGLKSSLNSIILDISVIMVLLGCLIGRRFYGIKNNK